MSVRAEAAGAADDVPGSMLVVWSHGQGCWWCLSYSDDRAKVVGMAGSVLMIAEMVHVEVVDVDRLDLETRLSVLDALDVPPGVSFVRPDACH